MSKLQIRKQLDFTLASVDSNRAKVGGEMELFIERVIRCYGYTFTFHYRSQVLFYDQMQDKHEGSLHE